VKFVGLFVDSYKTNERAKMEHSFATNHVSYYTFLLFEKEYPCITNTAHATSEQETEKKGTGFPFDWLREKNNKKNQRLLSYQYYD
jgi:hypothetical protein